MAPPLPCNWIGVAHHAWRERNSLTAARRRGGPPIRDYFMVLRLGHMCHVRRTTYCLDLAGRPASRRGVPVHG